MIASETQFQVYLPCLFSIVSSNFARVHLKLYTGPAMSGVLSRYPLHLGDNSEEEEGSDGAAKPR